MRLYGYDAGGGLLYQRTLAKSDSSVRGKVEYHYYSTGQLSYYKAWAGTSTQAQITTDTYGVLRDTRLLDQTVVTNEGSTARKSSALEYDLNGNLASVTGDNARTLISDSAGHVLEKNQGGILTHTLIANGQMIGSSSGAYESFSSVYESVTANAQNTDAGVYVVQANGEKLTAIAKNIWGDERLWYVIADANGLTTGGDLKAGQSLIIPPRMSSTYNGADTFKPYVAADIVGSTTPELAMPQAAAASGGGCGALGQLIMVVVAVAVTIYTAGAIAGPAASGWSTGLSLLSGTADVPTGMAIVAGAVGGAAGSIASQAVGIAIGAQDSFNWKAVALSAIGTAATLGIGAAAKAGTISASFGGPGWEAAARKAALSNVISQGVGMTTGLQDGFQWRSVAASAAGAGVGTAVGGALGDWNPLLRSTASGFVGGATTALLGGGKFNVMRVATDAFGNALGNSLAEQMRPSTTASRSASGGIGRSSSSGANNVPLALQSPQMNYTEEAAQSRDALRDFVEKARGPAPQMSYDRGVNWSNLSATEKAIIQDDIGYDYQTSPHDADGHLSARIDRVKRITIDERLAWAQESVIKFSGEMDEVASAAGSSTGARVFAAATYGVRKIAGDTISGIIGLPRLVTSNTMTPSLVNAAMSPRRTANGMAQHFNALPTQDKWIVGLEAALPLKGNSEALAGRVPKIGGFLSGELGYRSDQGITLSANGKLYGFVDEGIAHYRAGPMAYQAGAVTRVRFGVSSDNEFTVAKHGEMPSPRPGFHSHHGVMSAWMKGRYSEYNPDLAPAVLMPDTNHRATFGVYNTWRAEALAEMGGQFEWSKVSESNMKGLSEKMFNAAEVPATTRQDYWDWYEKMIRALNK